jgi:uncharacterized protein (DUF433 family)
MDFENGNSQRPVGRSNAQRLQQKRQQRKIETTRNTRKPYTPQIRSSISAIQLGAVVVIKAPQVLGGTPVFRGTRVPFQALFDYLEGGQTLDEFLDDFPTVTRNKAIAALERAQALVVSNLE